MTEERHDWPSEADLAVICGARIRELRAARSLSQRALAEQLQISKSMVTRYETGHHTPPAAVLMRLARVFRVPVDSVLGYTGSSPRLVQCLQAIEQLDDDSRFVVVETLESIVDAMQVLLGRRTEGPRP